MMRIGPLRRGLIPAHAGKTTRKPPMSWPPTAHPRSRGENYGSGPLRGGRWGSSPLTRGKLVREATPEDGSRLIPAHAGKTKDARRVGRGRRAHPRSRGENGRGRSPTWRWSGSSPLTRGKRVHDQCGQSMLGLIPAHAGKTYAPVLEGSRGPAHPRSRGENTS